MTIEDLETPALVVDLDILSANLDKVAAYTRRHALNLRPHTKTHKIPEIARMQMESGCSGITVAKSGEAAVMAAAGLDNILVAYPVVGQAKAKRLAELARERKISVAVDSLTAAQGLSEAANAAGTTLTILVEVDVGLRRSGVTPEAAPQLAMSIDQMPNVKFGGLTIYPGHIWASPDEQGRELGKVAEKLGEVLDRLSKRGLECEVVSGGSTPSALNSHLVSRLTEIRPGTYVFNDRNTMGLNACEISDCALRVSVTVVSNAVPGRAIVDAGSKTLSGDRWLSGDRVGFGYIVEDPNIPIEAISEEHGHLDLARAAWIPRVGDRLSIIPNHVCTCVNMHDRVWYHRKGIVEGYWNVAGRGKVA